jgi:hypothetical protein
MQRAQPDQFLPGVGTTRLPVVALQILQQRNALFEPLQIVGHRAFFASRESVGEKQRYSQARMVGGGSFQRRKGQTRARNGNMVCQRNGSES